MCVIWPPRSKVRRMCSVCRFAHRRARSLHNGYQSKLRHKHAWIQYINKYNIIEMRMRRLNRRRRTWYLRVYGKYLDVALLTTHSIVRSLSFPTDVIIVNGVYVVTSFSFSFFFIINSPIQFFLSVVGIHVAFAATFYIILKYTHTVRSQAHRFSIQLKSAFATNREINFFGLYLIRHTFRPNPSENSSSKRQSNHLVKRIE